MNNKVVLLFMGVCTIMYKIGSSTTTTSQAKFAEKIVTVAAHLRPHGTAPSPHANRGGLAQWLLPLWLLLRLVLLLVLLLLHRLLRRRQRLGTGVAAAATQPLPQPVHGCEKGESGPWGDVKSLLDKIRRQARDPLGGGGGYSRTGRVHVGARGEYGERGGAGAGGESMGS